MVYELYLNKVVAYPSTPKACNVYSSVIQTVPPPNWP